MGINEFKVTKKLKMLSYLTGHIFKINKLLFSNMKYLLLSPLNTKISKFNYIAIWCK